MREIRYVITDPMGLHARPAGLLAKLTRAYESSVMLSAKEKSVACGRMMAVIALQVKQGDEVVIAIDGPDENRAYDEVLAFCKKNM